MSQSTCPNTPTCCSTPTCPSTPTKPTCPGCYPIYQPNQLAHMDEGGCLYLDFSDELVCGNADEADDVKMRYSDLFSSDEDDDDEDEDDDDEDVTIIYSDLVTQESVSDTISVSSSISIIQPLSGEKKKEIVECCICYDPISTEKNNCVTECGHQFCFKCLATSMMTNGCTCPCCRSPLVEMSSDDDEDDDEDLDDDDDMSFDTENEVECDIEELTRRIKANGFEMKDVLSMLLGRYTKGSSDMVMYDLNKKFDEIVDEADNETVEQEAMGLEDRRIFV